MGRYGKMRNRYDDETLKAKSSGIKIQEALKIIDGLVELSSNILKECDKDPDLNDLAIKYLLNQKQSLEKLKETLS